MVTSKLMRAASLAAMATASLYAVMVLVAEPTRSLAENMVVDVRLAETISLSCTGSGANVHINNYAPMTASSTGYGEGSCQVISNNDAGYTLKWNIAEGSGGTDGFKTGTGHLNSFLQNGVNAYTIRSFHKSSDSQGTTAGLNGIAKVDVVTHSALSSNTDIRWAGRVKRSSDSDYIESATPNFGDDTDATTKQFASVTTGSAIAIAKRTSPTDSDGDTETLEFVVAYGSANYSPATTYKSTVILTATNN